MKRLGRIGLVVGLAILAAATVLLATRGTPVRLAKVQRHPVQQTVVVSGRVAAAARVSIGSVVVGRVVEVKAREGDRVAAGDLLVALEDREARASLEQSRAALRQAEARVEQVARVTGRVATEEQRQSKAALELAEKRFARLQALEANGASTTDELDQARAQAEQARARYAATQSQAWGAASPSGAEAKAAKAALEMARANVEAAQARLDQASVRAPSGGVIVARNVEPGDVVQPGAALLGLAVDGAPYLVVQPDEKNLNLLREGQEAVASADAFPGRTFPARVDRILPAVDRLRGTVEVRLSLPQPPDFLRPDMTVSVEIRADRRESAIALPETAVHEAQGRQSWVWVVRDGRVVRRDVKAGLRGEDRVEVVEGLDEGEIVVAGDGLALEPGQRVRAARE